MSFDYMYKLVIVGDSGVGKSSINIQFLEKQTILNHNATIGVEFGAKIIDIQGKKIKVQIWDTAGQENFRSLARSYYQNAIGVLLVYDITKRSTFEGVKGWFSELKENGNKNMEILLVGNKSDLESKRVISFQQGKKFAQENSLNFMEISAHEYEKVNSAFQALASAILKKFESGHISIQHRGISLGDSPKKQSATYLASNKKPQGRCC